MYYTGFDGSQEDDQLCMKDASDHIHRQGTIGATRNELDVWMATLEQPWTAARAAMILSWRIYITCFRTPHT